MDQSVVLKPRKALFLFLLCFVRLCTVCTPEAYKIDGFLVLFKIIHPSVPLEPIQITGSLMLCKIIQKALHQTAIGSKLSISRALFSVRVSKAYTVLLATVV